MSGTSGTDGTDYYNPNNPRATQAGGTVEWDRWRQGVPPYRGGTPVPVVPLVFRLDYASSESHPINKNKTTSVPLIRCWHRS